MAEHRCEWIIEFELVEREDGNFSIPLTACAKVAHFKSDLDGWYCAEHWDELQRLFEKDAFYRQGREVCGICNCEFHEGECNCGRFEHGA